MKAQPKIDEALPNPQLPEMQRLERERLSMMATRFRILHPGKVGRHWPPLHVPLMPSKSVTMPLVKKDVLELLGLSLKPLTTYDVDYFGAVSEGELEYAKAQGLLRFPGLWFSILEERK